MAGRAATEELELIEVGGAGGADRGDGGWGPDEGGAPAPPQRVYLTGIWLALASILMFFTALVSAYVVRQGISTDWAPFPLPGILWGNTLVLLASSVTLERARRLMGRGDEDAFRRWWLGTTVLGLLFLVGQVVAWGQLASAGVYLASNPSSSFFYVLTTAHGLHLLGGIAALLYIGFRKELQRASVATATTAAAAYWHFLGGLWVLLFGLLNLRG